jgi:Tfp pilus assembly protein PilF
VLLELGETALFNQDYPQAIDLLGRAREADPANRFVYQPLSRAYLRTGQTDLAAETKRRGDEITKRLLRISELTSKMIREPHNPELRYETGMLCLAGGAHDSGAVWLLTALKYDPDHRKTHAALADYYEGIGNAAAAGRHRRMAEAQGKRDAANQSKSGSS